MARQAVVVVALALLATVAFAAQAPAATPSGGDATPKAALPTFAAVPAAAAGPAGNANEVGTVAGSDDAAPAASGKGASDAVAAAPVGGPVADGAFGRIEGAQSPSSGATTAQVSAIIGAAVAASFFFF